MGIPAPSADTLEGQAGPSNQFSDSHGKSHQFSEDSGVRDTKSVSSHSRSGSQGDIHLNIDKEGGEKERIPPKPIMVSVEC